MQSADARTWAKKLSDVWIGRDARLTHGLLGYSEDRESSSPGWTQCRVRKFLRREGVMPCAQAGPGIFGGPPVESLMRTGHAVWIFAPC
ncbi:hypothetical protein TNCV_327031 [Trichonephila clavipes]|nr:hypothetical protein TNCV_327031 [Trichonephila clavipes]